MSCRPSPVMSASRTRGSARSMPAAVPLRDRGALPGAAGVGVVEPALQPSARTRSDVGQPVAVEVDQLHARVVEADGRRLPVRLERAPAPPAGERHREVPGLGRRLDQQVGAAVAVGVEELHARVAEALRRRLGDRAGQLEPAAAGLRQIPGGGAEFDDVGQPAAAQVDQRQRRVAERGGSAGPARSRGSNRRRGRVEAGVAERQRRQRARRSRLAADLVVDRRPRRRGSAARRR